ncbi:Uncharacterized protein Rs2_19019 [Raphanus sativus]|nr:Uncharacterized protein Rs2_19019 [Raphanus sativus]
MCIVFLERKKGNVHTFSLGTGRNVNLKTVVCNKDCASVLQRELLESDITKRVSGFSKHSRQRRVETFVSDINSGRWDSVLPQVSQLKLPRNKLEEQLLCQISIGCPLLFSVLSNVAVAALVTVVPPSRLMALIGQALKWQQHQDSSCDHQKTLQVWDYLHKWKAEEGFAISLHPVKVWDSKTTDCLQTFKPPPSLRSKSALLFPNLYFSKTRNCSASAIYQTGGLEHFMMERCINMMIHIRSFPSPVLLLLAVKCLSVVLSYLAIAAGPFLSNFTFSFHQASYAVGGATHGLSLLGLYGANIVTRSN